MATHAVDVRVKAFENTRTDDEVRCEKSEVGTLVPAENGGRTPIRSFRDLEVYKRSMTLLRPVHDLVKGFPAYEQRDLADQLRRASKSIPATIAEGYARKESAREFRRYLRIAMGSATEIEVHFAIALELGYINAQQHAFFLGEYQAIARMLYRLINAWKKYDEPDVGRQKSDFRHPTSDFGDVHGL